jgi:hypothetical protein
MEWSNFFQKALNTVENSLDKVVLDIQGTTASLTSSSSAGATAVGGGGSKSDKKESLKATVDTSTLRNENEPSETIKIEKEESIEAESTKETMKETKKAESTRSQSPKVLSSPPLDSHEAKESESAATKKTLNHEHEALVSI